MAIMNSRSSHPSTNQDHKHPSYVTMYRSLDGQEQSSAGAGGIAAMKEKANQNRAERNTGIADNAETIGIPDSQPIRQAHTAPSRSSNSTYMSGL